MVKWLAEGLEFNLFNKIFPHLCRFNYAYNRSEVMNPRSKLRSDLKTNKDEIIRDIFVPEVPYLMI